MAAKKRWGELRLRQRSPAARRKTSKTFREAEMEVKAEVAAGKMKDVRTIHDAAMILAKVPESLSTSRRPRPPPRSRAHAHRARPPADDGRVEQHDRKNFQHAVDDAEAAGITVPGDLHCEAAVAEHPQDHQPDHVKQPRSRARSEQRQRRRGAAAGGVQLGRSEGEGQSDYTQGNFPQAMVSFKKAWSAAVARNRRSSPAPTRARARRSAETTRRACSARSHRSSKATRSSSRSVFRISIDPRK